MGGQDREAGAGRPSLWRVWGERQTGGSESSSSRDQALGTLGWLEEGGPLTEGMGSRGMR